MKKIFIAVLDLCLLGLAAPTVRADDAATNAPPKKAHMRSPLLKYDANKDGTLDDSEIAKLKQDFADGKAPGLKKYDTNGNGKIDDDEVDAIKTAFAKAVKHHKKKDASQ